jgi:hypothetical protein
MLDDQHRSPFARIDATDAPVFPGVVRLIVDHDDFSVQWAHAAQAEVAVSQPRGVSSGSSL